MTKKLPSLTIGIPAYNEAGNITALLGDLKAQKQSGFRLVKVIKEYHCKRSFQLTFLMGQLIIRAIGAHSRLILSDEFEMSMNELHFVDAEIDTLCLLFQR